MPYLVLRRLARSLSLVCVLASPGAAQSIIARPTGLTGPFTSFDFNGLPLNAGDAVNTQLAGADITFEGAYFGTVGDAFLFGSPALYSYQVNQRESDAIVVHFTMRTSGAAFNFASGLAKTTFRAWNGDVLVGSIELADTGAPLLSTGLGFNTADASLFRWWGFQFTDGVTTFDRITISSTPNNTSIPKGFGLDNLQVTKLETTVPEPGTIGLLAVGLLGLAATVRRRTPRASGER